MSKKQRKFLISGIVIAGALLAIVFTGFKGNQVYYVTVDQLQAKAPELAGEHIKMAGNVQDGSIKKDDTNLHTTFTIEQNGKTVPVEYQGITPDMFKDGAEVIVEGTYTQGGVFKADNLMAKCASKYEAKVTDMEAMKTAKESTGY